MSRPRSISDDQLRDAARRAFLEHGPHVSAAAIGRELGVSGPAVLQRAGSKEALLRLALCSADRPEWLAALVAGPGSAQHPRTELVDLLLALAGAAAEFLPVLAVLRTSGVDVRSALPLGEHAPPRVARRAVAAWLGRSGVADPDVAAELLVGSLEARAFLSWAHPGAAAPTRPDVEALLSRFWPEES